MQRSGSYNLPEPGQIAIAIQCSYNVQMLLSKTAIILALILSIQMLGACVGKTSDANTSNTANTGSANISKPETEGVKDNADELATLARLTFEPEEVAWKETTAGDKRKLLAVLRFTPVDSKKIIENAAKVKPGQNVSIPSERWFPAELVSQSEMSGDETITATAYAADEFFLPPYTEGRLSRVGNSDFFVLELTAK